jgi:hypothetical protein
MNLRRNRRSLPLLTLLILFATACWQSPSVAQQNSQQPAQTAPPVPAKEAPAKEPTSAELSRTETVGSAVLRIFKYQEYEVRSAAEAMPADKYDFRPAAGVFAKEKPVVGPAEVRTFAEQVKHIACANFAFSAELDGREPPPGCDTGGQNATRNSGHGRWTH